MADDLDAKVIRNTQLSLGKYVKRPPLSDKLLRKPPFRFLHDIVTSILKSKGFFEGLFDENELISENVKERESKISFLNKVITVVSLTTDKPLTVKASKIVAGQEPAKTNELLQCLAHALDNDLSSDEAVRRFKSGIKIPPHSDNKNKESVKPLKKNIETKKLTSRSSEKLITTEKDGQSLSKSKNKDISVHKKESPPKKSLSKTSNKKPMEKSNQEEQKRALASDQKNKPGNQKPTDNQKDLLVNEDTVVQDEEVPSNEKTLQLDINLEKDVLNMATNYVEKKVVLHVSESKPTSADKFMRVNEQSDILEINKIENINETYSLTTTVNEIQHGNRETEKQSTYNSEDTGVSEPIQMESEESNLATTGNNFDKTDLNHQASSTIRPSSVRPSSSRPGAPRIREKNDMMNDTENILVGKVNIISENTLHEEEKDTSIIIENNTKEELYETFQNQNINNVVNQNSHLVQQILESQREFSQISGKTEIEWQFGAQKAPDIFIQEMEQLKFSVQALSRISNPLGKVMDHIQEDVEVMRQELQQWTQLYEETSKDLLVQKNATNEALLPFHTKLKQLTADMEERHEKITDLKISIYKNDLRIEKLLTNSNVQ